MEYCGKPNFTCRDDDNFCAAFGVAEERQLKECSDDFILPDYMPDAKKIVWVKAQPALDGRFLGVGTLEYDGTITYDVLYIAEDDSLKSARFTTGFSNKLEGADINSDCVDLVIPVYEQVVCRMLNPRKINIRCKAGTDISIWKRRCFLPELYGGSVSESMLETRFDTVPAMNIVNVREGELALSEDLIIDKAYPPISELIYSNAELNFDDCRAGAGEILCHGSCDIECLYRSDGEEKSSYYVVKRSIPISQTVEAPEVTEKCECYAIGLPGTLEFNLREDEFGQMRIIEVDFNYGIDIECVSAKTISYAGDCYSTSGECLATMSKVGIRSLCGAVHGNFSVNESVPAADVAAPENGSVISARADINFGGNVTESKKGRLMLTGEAKITVLAEDANGLPTEFEFILPIHCETDQKIPGEPVVLSGNSHTSGLRCRIDGDKVYVDFEVCYNILEFYENEHELAENIKLIPGQAEEDKRTSVLLYYPSEKETLWDVAKEYRVSCDAIMNENGIEDRTAQAGKVLRIPRRGAVLSKII